MKSDSKKQSVVISIRLHPDDPLEADALRIIKEWQNQGYSNREIITNAILRAEGAKPEMYSEKPTPVSRDALKETLQEFAQYIIDNVGVAQPKARYERPRPFGDDEIEITDTMQNLAQGFLNRRKSK